MTSGSAPVSGKYSVLTNASPDMLTALRLKSVSILAVIFFASPLPIINPARVLSRPASRFLFQGFELVQARVFELFFFLPPPLPVGFGEGFFKRAQLDIRSRNHMAQQQGELIG